MEEENVRRKEEPWWRAESGGDVERRGKNAEKPRRKAGEGDVKVRVRFCCSGKEVLKRL